MRIKKVFVYSVVFVSILTIAGSAMAVKLENPLGATDTFCKLLTNIASEVGKLIAVLGTIMIIVAGILYLTSAGSPEKMTKAKTALIYAIAGMAIGLSATAIAETIKSVIKAGGGGC